MNIQEITLGQLLSLENKTVVKSESESAPNPMIGRKCIVRCYSAGVHIGKVLSVNGTEVHLSDALRLWKWTGGNRLSLSSVANRGITNGRIELTNEVFLTEAIELIPITEEAWDSFVKFIEK